jgi:nondiscriminating glutamyl-tRNA synthetase
VFDEVKLKWVNAQHLRALPHAELWKRLTPFFMKAGLELPSSPDWQDRSLSVFKTSMETLVDAVELYRPLSTSAFQIFDEAKETLGWATSKAVVTEWKKRVVESGKEYLSDVEFMALQDGVKTACNVKGKELFMPIRVAVVGKPHGSELKILVPLMSTKTLAARADQVLAQMK